MDLRNFSKANLQRCESPTGFNHALNSWHPTQWTNAMAGECGEACNATKKLLRHDQDIRGNKGDDTDREIVRQKAMKECADAIVYADLTIQALGGDTASVLRSVFNAKSLEIGSDILV